MRRTATFTLALFVALGGLAACGDDDDDSEATAGDSSAAEADAGSDDPAGQTTPAEQPATGGDTGGKAKPTVEVPATAPTELVVTDIEVGTGAAAENGKTLSMHYVGVAFSDKQQFDASWDGPAGPKPFDFVLGAGKVIPGWDQGLVGMKVGGRRQLVIPPALGYGAAGYGPIKGNETLVFVVDMLAVS